MLWAICLGKEKRCFGSVSCLTWFSLNSIINNCPPQISSSQSAVVVIVSYKKVGAGWTAERHGPIQLWQDRRGANFLFQAYKEVFFISSYPVVFYHISHKSDQLLWKNILVLRGVKTHGVKTVSVGAFLHLHLHPWLFQKSLCACQKYDFIADVN